MVKVFSTSMEYDYESPWQSLSPEAAFGSGVCIPGSFILTAAHVVADATFIQVQKARETTKVVAELYYVDHQCDLALLTVTERGFFDNMKVTEVGTEEYLPSLRRKVQVVGFPIGGEEVSVTEGVVSRVEIQSYTHSRRKLLAITVDAAINSGNSGGPVFLRNKVLGIAVQAYDDAQNIGEIVPCPIIQHFLRRAKTRDRRSFPDFGASFQNLEGKQLRKFKGMDDGEEGVLIKAVSAEQKKHDDIRVGDVLLQVDGRSVSNQGTVHFDSNGRFRTIFHVVFHRYQIGDKVPVRVLRDGKREDIHVTLIPWMKLVPRSQYDIEPRFYVFGGLVFQPLTRNFLNVWGDDDWRESAPLTLVYQYYNGSLKDDLKEVVVFSTILADEINVGLNGYQNSVVKEVNGERVVDLLDFVNKVEAIKDGMVQIVTMGNVMLAFDAAEAAASAERILSRYRIARDRHLGKTHSSAARTVAQQVSEPNVE